MANPPVYVSYSIVCWVFCRLPGPDQGVGPSGERLRVLLPQRRGNVPPLQTRCSGPPRCCPAGLVPAGDTLPSVQSGLAAGSVSVFHNRRKQNDGPLSTIESQSEPSHRCSHGLLLTTPLINKRRLSMAWSRPNAGTTTGKGGRFLNWALITRVLTALT